MSKHMMKQFGPVLLALTLLMTGCARSPGSHGPRHTALEDTVARLQSEHSQHAAELAGQPEPVPVVTASSDPSAMTTTLPEPPATSGPYPPVSATPSEPEHPAPAAPARPEPPVVASQQAQPVVTAQQPYPPAPVAAAQLEPPAVPERPEPPVVAQPQPPAVPERPEPPVMATQPEPPAVATGPEPSARPMQYVAPMEEEPAQGPYPPEPGAEKRPAKHFAPEGAAPRHEQPAPVAQVAQAAPTASAGREKPALADQQLYIEAIRAITAGHTEAARNMLNELMTKYPHSPKAPEALFWTGESYVLDNRCGEAAVVFKDVVARYPENPGEVAARALVRLAGVYGRMGNVEDAKAGLKTLLARYPGSPYAQRVKQQLPQLAP